jgi:hypothetical protein
VKEGVTRIQARRSERTAMIEALSNPPTPWLYVIVATGNIYEDIIQAQAAARQGANDALYGIIFRDIKRLLHHWYRISLKGIHAKHFL